MSNPFKNILSHYDVPKVLKKKVLNDINMIKFSLDVADLFLVKYPSTIGDVIGGKKRKPIKKPTKK